MGILRNSYLLLVRIKKRHSALDGKDDSGGARLAKSPISEEELQEEQNWKRAILKW